MSAASVLLVCLGNICRSPTAEAAIRDAADRAGVDISVRSAGTGSWHVGARADARMRHFAGRAGLELDGVAELVDADMLADADLVLAMDTSNFENLRALAEREGVSTPIRLFREFDPLADEYHLDVPDPYQGGDEGFIEVVEICRRTAESVVSHLSEWSVGR